MAMIIFHQQKQLDLVDLLEKDASGYALYQDMLNDNQIILSTMQLTLLVTTKGLGEYNYNYATRRNGSTNNYCL